jgi:ABC-type sugar transport system substrate-binding protein
LRGRSIKIKAEKFCIINKEEEKMNKKMVSLLTVSAMAISMMPLSVFAEEDLITVGYAQVGAESDWRTANTESFKSTFTEENGYKLIFDDAQQKQENQIKAIRSFIQQEVDYIVVAPVVETGWETVLQEAADAGIPVILSDRMMDLADDSLYTCWVGGNFTLEGETCGDWLAAYLEEQGRGEEEINIVTIQGTIGASAQIGRTEGFAKKLAEHENWKMLDMQSGEFTQAKGQEVMESFLKSYDDIDVVICENDNEAFGAIDAIKAAGKTCGPDGDIIVVSFDAVKAAFDSMIAGDLNATFECNPLHGPRVAEIIQKLEAGEEVEKIQYVDEAFFDTTMDLEAIQAERAY